MHGLELPLSMRIRLLTLQCRSECMYADGFISIVVRF